MPVKVVVQAGPPVYMFLDDVLVLVLGPLGVFRLRLLRLHGRVVRQERVRVPDATYLPKRLPTEKVLLRLSQRGAAVAAASRPVVLLPRPQH